MLPDYHFWRLTWTYGISGNRQGSKSFPSLHDCRDFANSIKKISTVWSYVIESVCHPASSSATESATESATKLDAWSRPKHNVHVKLPPASCIGILPAQEATGPYIISYRHQTTPGASLCKIFPTIEDLKRWLLDYSNTYYDIAIFRLGNKIDFKIEKQVVLK